MAARFVVRRRQIKTVQVRINRLFAQWKLGFKPLNEDGKMGPMTRRYIKLARFFLGLGPDGVAGQDASITLELIRTLGKPNRRIKGFSVIKNLARRRTAAKRRRARRKKERERQEKAKGSYLAAPGPPGWSGSKRVVEEIHWVWAKFGIPVSSMKRPSWHPLSQSNPASDHNEANRTAYAEDGATFTGAAAATAIRRHYGNFENAIGTFAPYFVRRAGRLFRLQTLWAVAGHFNHDHHGARA